MRRTTVLAVVVTALAGVLATAAPAAAVYPDPNGRIYFVHDTPKCEGCHATTIDPDGTDAAHVPESHEAGWSPDGTRLATYSVRTDGRLGTVLIDPDGSNRVVFDIPDPTLNLPCTLWTSDAQRLICEGWDDNDPDRGHGIYSVDASDGQDLVQIVVNPYGGADIPMDLSPDGTEIVFLREDPSREHRTMAIFTVGIDGSDLTQVGGWRSTGICCHVSWSPDGAAFLFATRGALHTVGVDGAGYATISIDTGSDFAFAFGPAWSPDGTRLAFSLYLASTDEADLYTAEVDGTDLVALTDTPTFEGGIEWGPAPPVGA
jgi:Tol biopolymer transport system component